MSIRKNKTYWINKIRLSSLVPSIEKKKTRGLFSNGLTPRPWLKCPSEFLNYVAHFNQMKNLTATLVINDSSERANKLVSDVANSNSKEEDRQSFHLAMQQRRDQLC